MNHEHMFINAGDSRSRGAKVLRIIGMAFMGVVFAAGFALVFGLLVMWLWNWLMPGLFGLGEITYWQAFGVLLLAKIFFGGFGSHKREPSDHWINRKEVGDRKQFRQFWKDEGEAKYREYIRRKEEGKEPSV